jgi:hypothetical protein
MHDTSVNIISIQNLVSTTLEAVSPCEKKNELPTAVRLLDSLPLDFYSNV